MTRITPAIDGITTEEQEKLRYIAALLSDISGEYEDYAGFVRNIADRAKFWNKEQVRVKRLRAGDQVLVFNKDLGEIEVKTVKEAGRWGHKSTRVQFEDGVGLLFGSDATVHRLTKEN